MTGYFPRIHTALAEWLACVALLLPLSIHELRVRQIAVDSLFLMTLLTTFSVMERWQIRGAGWIALMLLAMLQMYLMVGPLRGRKPAAALYTWAHAFLLAELAASVEWNFNYYLIRGGVITAMAQTYICMALVYGLIFGGYYFVRRHRGARANEACPSPGGRRSAR